MFVRSSLLVTAAAERPPLSLEWFPLVLNTKLNCLELVFLPMEADNFGAKPSASGGWEDLVNATLIFLFCLQEVNALCLLLTSKHTHIHTYMCMHTHTLLQPSLSTLAQYW